MVDANLGTIAHGCHEADARLISAAPDMLAALLDVLDCIVCDNPHDDPTQQTYSIRGPMRDALVSAHEAIARAEGAK